MPTILKLFDIGGYWILRNWIIVDIVRYFWKDAKLDII